MSTQTPSPEQRRSSPEADLCICSDEWPYFEPFLNLPPRTLKEYFSIITEPLSLKGLQKLVKGIHGRHHSTGVSDFKGWAAFEEKSSLLWTNAHYFNEEGSEIYNLATELKVRVPGWHGG